MAYAGGGKKQKILTNSSAVCTLSGLGLVLVGGGGSFVSVVEQLVDVLLELLELLLDLDVGGGGPGGFVSVVE